MESVSSEESMCTGDRHGEWYGPARSFCGRCGTCGRCGGTGNARIHRLAEVLGAARTGSGCRFCRSSGRDPKRSVGERGSKMEPSDDLQTEIEKRRNDPEYQERLRRHLDENRATLDRLAER